jgi:hypothetical protein
MNTIKLLSEAFKVNSPKFVSIRNYRNAEGEIANYLINLGVDYTSQRDKDIEKLTKVSYRDESMNKEIARLELLTSMINNKHDTTRSAGSQAQLDAYHRLHKNIRIHEVKGELYLFGMVVKKEVIKAANVRHSWTIKDTVKKELNLRTRRCRQFKFSNLSGTVICINNNAIEITYENH